MKIDSIAAQPDRAGRHLVRFSDGTVMRLYRQTIEDHALYTGMELDDEAFAALKADAGKMSAKMRAVRIVAAGNVSRSDLERRLIRKGEDPDQAKEAVNWMEDLSLVDDEKTAEQIVQRCISRGYGKARAKQALYEKRIPHSLWEKALEGYPEQTDKILAFLQSKLVGEWDGKDLKRAVDALLRRGHSYSEIRAALEQLRIDTDDLQEDS